MNKESITLTLSPEESMKDSLSAEIPSMPVVNTKIEDKDYSAGTIDESMLSDEEREKVNQFVTEIDILNVDQLAADSNYSRNELINIILRHGIENIKIE